MRRSMIVLFTFFLFSAVQTPSKDLAEFPLRVAIMETHFTQTPYGSAKGSGYGNLKDGDSLRGFDWTCLCDRPFGPSQGGGAYPARWKKINSRLVILGQEIGNASKQRECELRITMRDLVYASKDGHIVTYTLDQWKTIVDARRTLEAALHPSDTNPNNYPLKIALLDMTWESYPAGGYTGVGRGNIHDKDNVTGFDFAALCPGRLQTTLPGAFYMGRWNPESKRLLILLRNTGDDATARACELRTTTRPNNVYVRNSTTGIVGVMTREEFEKQRTDPPASAKAELSEKRGKLSNADVIAMVGIGLSNEVILAKIGSSQCEFDTSAEALRVLRSAHVPDQIVVEMITGPGSR